MVDECSFNVKACSYEFLVTEGCVGEGGGQDEDAVSGVRGAGVGCAVAGGRLSGSVDREAGCDVLVGFLAYDEEAFQVNRVLFDVCHVYEFHGAELDEDFV